MKLKEWKQQDPEAGKYFSLLVRVGVGMVSSILMCFFLGLALIKYIHLNVLFIAAFVVMGVSLGFTYVYFQLKKL